MLAKVNNQQLAYFAINFNFPQQSSPLFETLLYLRAFYFTIKLQRLLYLSLDPSPIMLAWRCDVPSADSWADSPGSLG